MINFLISIFTNLTLITLIVSVASFVYAVLNNKYSVEVTDIKFETNREHYYLTFKLTNTSTKSLKIEKVTLSRNNHLISKIDFSPEDYDDNKQKQKAKEWEDEQAKDSETFVGFKMRPVINPHDHPILRVIPLKHHVIDPNLPLLLTPYQQVTFSIYVSGKPDTIAIYTNKRMIFKKKKSFSV